MTSTLVVRKLFTRRLTPLKIAAIYVLVGGLWILFSDKLLSVSVKNPQLLTELQTFKGWFYVVVTAFLLYALIGRSMAALQQSEAALRESAEHFRQLAENIREVFWLKSLETNQIIYVSPAYEEIWGRNRNSVYEQAMSWSDAIHPEDRERVLSAFEKQLWGEGDYSQEYRIVRPDGEVRWICDRAFPIYNRVGKVYRLAGIAEDITERHQTLAALQKLNEELDLRVQEQTSELRQALERLEVEMLERQRAESAVKAAYHDLEIKVEQRTLELREANASLTEQIKERTRAEAAVGQSQEKLQAIIDNSTAVIYLKDSEGRFMLINCQFESLFHVTREQVIGKTDYDVFPKDLADAFQVNDRRVIDSGEVIKIEEDAPQHDGLHTYISIKFPLYDATHSLYAVGGISTDITERKQAEQKLRDSEHRFRSVFEQAPFAIQLFTPDGFLEQTNQAWEQMWGTTRDTSAGYNLLHDRQAEGMGHLPYFQKAFAGESVTLPPVYYDPTLSNNPGRPRWIEVHLYSVKDEAENVQEVVLMTRDISDRKQTELALQSSEERFRRAILDAPLPIMLHGEDGEVVQINQTWTELTGYTHSDIPTIADWTEKAYGSRKEVVQADIERLYNLDRRISEGEYTVTTRNGEAQIWEFYSAPLGRLSDGRRLVISTAIDITKRKQAEAEIRQLNETLEQRVAERTAQLEEANQQLEAFAYSIAHDLRAPLRGMQGLAEALLEDYSKCLDALGQEYTHHLVSSAQRLDNLINDLLTYSRLSRAELRLSIVDLNLVMSEAMTQVEAELKQQQATVTLLSVLPKVRGHRTTLVQVVTNLLTNAIKFVENTQPQVQIWAETQDEWVQLWVADNGIGILPEHQQRIFRVFERLHGIETYSGTGIGLAIVQKGVERMGGQVGVESELGKGSRFWFKLRSEHC